MPHEAINAILHRPDYDEVRHIPIGVLPGGSANAFCKNICHELGIHSGILENSLIIAKGLPKPIDLMKFTTKDNHIIFSFLSLAWAFISDVDLGSEKLRFLGGARFDIYGAWKTLTLKPYSAELSFSN